MKGKKIAIIVICFIVGFIAGFVGFKVLNKEKNTTNNNNNNAVAENKVENNTQTSKLNATNSTNSTNSSTNSSTNNTNTTGSNTSEHKKIYIGREGDNNDYIDMKLNKSSLRYEMYYSDDFKIEINGNKEEYKYTQINGCGIIITKTDESYNNYKKDLDKYGTKYDIVVARDDVERILVEGNDEGITFKRFILANGENSVFEVEMYYPSSMPELAEGIGKVMDSMIETFKVG